MNDSVTSMLTDSDYTSWGKDLIMCVTVESLCCILEANLILYISYTSIKKAISYLLLHNILPKFSDLKQQKTFIISPFL